MDSTLLPQTPPLPVSQSTSARIDPTFTADPNLIIRLATDDDAPALAALGAHVYNLTFAHSVTVEDMEAFLSSTYTPELMLDALHDPKQSVFVATITTTLHTPSSSSDSSLRLNHVVTAARAITAQLPNAPPPPTRTGPLAGLLILQRGSTEPCLAAYPPAIELLRLYVHPSFHGSRPSPTTSPPYTQPPTPPVAHSLVATAVAIAKNEGWAAMWLGVWEDNARAQRFYQKWGFEKVGSHDFMTGSCVQRDLVMLKML